MIPARGLLASLVALAASWTATPASPDRDPSVTPTEERAWFPGRAPEDPG